MGSTNLELQFNENNRGDYLFELGKSRSLLGNFLSSIRMLKEAANFYIQKKNYSRYMECLSLLFRMYKELKDIPSIIALKEELMNLVTQEGVQISARVHYTLGLCALYMGNIDEAREEFEKSMDQVKYLEGKAIRENNEEEILKARIESCFTLDGVVALAVRENNLDKATESLTKMVEHLNALKNLEKDLEEGRYSNISQGLELKKILQETSDLRRKLYLSTQLSKAAILRAQKRYHKAESLLWDCYEQVQKSKDLCTIVGFFYYLGQNYLDMREYNQASIFLNLAQKSIDYDNFRHLYEHVKNCQDKLQFIVSSNYDLIVDFAGNTVVERHKGKIDFKNQYILLGLLKIFLSTPGESYSKESLVEEVWKQKYDPRIHDNKVYVTIKRLRELIEPDVHHIRYIFCGKNGYYLDSKVRVLFKKPDDLNPRETVNEVLI